MIILLAHNPYVESENVEYPDFSNMDEKQFTESTLEIFVKNPQLFGDESLDTAFTNNASEYVDSVKALFDAVIPLQREYNPEAHNALWEIVAEAGSPYFRWTIVPDNQDCKSFMRIFQIPHYNPLTNTILVWPFDMKYGTESLIFYSFFAELANSTQFSQDPISAYGKAAAATVRTARRTLRGYSFGEAYQKEYETPGRLEYEAHSMIEPDLKKRILSSANN